jgi:hypothetical protein
VLFDLEADPLEMKNVFGDPASREAARTLAKALLEYAQTYKEPMLQDAGIAADLRWTAQGSGPYVAPARTPAGPANNARAERKAARKAAGKGKGRKRKQAGSAGE